MGAKQAMQAASASPQAIVRSMLIGLAITCFIFRRPYFLRLMQSIHIRSWKHITRNRVLLSIRLACGLSRKAHHICGCFKHPK